MNKEIFLLFFILILSFSVNALTYDDCDDPDLDLTGYANCEEVTACQNLAAANTYYLLMNDVSSSGTCFFISANNNINLDLNQKKAEYAQSQTGNGVRFANTINTLKIHNGKILGGYFPQSLGVNAAGWSSNNVEIYDLNISVQGEESDGIWLDPGSNTRVHHVNITMNSPKAIQCSHYGRMARGIGWYRRGGDVEIHDNRVIGRGNIGITMTDCLSWDPSNPALIYNNYISMFSDVGDGYAIAMAGRNNDCSDGTKIFNNVINQINGRGIAVAGWDSFNDYGPGNVEIFNNNITVRETCQCEYATGTGAGIRIRFGAHDISVHDNEIYGTAGLGLQDCEALRDGGKTIGLYVGNAYPYGKNNVYENNYIEVSTNTPGEYWWRETYAAVGIYSGGNAQTDPEKTVYFRNNTIKTNNMGLRVSFADGCGSNAQFEQSTVIKADNPIDFRTTSLGFNQCGAKSIAFIDTVGLNGADAHEYAFDAANGVLFDDINVSWTLTVNVQDQNGQPLVASVEVRDKNGQLVGSGTTIEGIYADHFRELSYSGLDPNVMATSYTPHIVEVNYNGEVQTQQVNLDDIKTVNFAFIVGPDTHPPVRSNPSPSGNLPAGNSQATLRISTNEYANCKHDTQAGVAYASMEHTFATTGQTNHQDTVSVSNGNTYTYYVKCMDDEGNANTDDTEITFSVAVPPGTLSAVHDLPADSSIVNNCQGFTYQTTLSCNGGLCGDVTATLDPLLSQGQLAYASSVEPDLPHTADRAADGSMATRWASAYVPDSWWYVDLGDYYVVNQVIIRWEAAYGEGYHIQVSDDASSWTTVFTENSGNGGTDDITFTPTSARYVRLLGFNPGPYSHISAWEIEAYGESDGIVPKGFVPMGSGTPFYTTSENPQTCHGLSDGGVCVLSWDVVANVTVNATYDFYVIYDALDPTITDINSTTISVNVNNTGCELPYDQPTCGCIDTEELLSSITGWYEDNISISELMNNIRTWKICSNE